MMLVTFELIREGHNDIIMVKLKVDIFDILEDTVTALKAKLKKYQCPECTLTLYQLFEDIYPDKENEPPMISKLRLENLLDGDKKVGCSVSGLNKSQWDALEDRVNNARSLGGNNSSSDRVYHHIR